MDKTIRIIDNHKPVYCHECRSQKSWERSLEGDILTESNQVYMIQFKCRVCGKICIMSNPEYKPQNVLTNPNY